MLRIICLVSSGSIEGFFFSKRRPSADTAKILTSSALALAERACVCTVGQTATSSMGWLRCVVLPRCTLLLCCSTSSSSNASRASKATHCPDVAYLHALERNRHAQPSPCSAHHESSCITKPTLGSSWVSLLQVAKPPLADRLTSKANGTHWARSKLYNIAANPRCSAACLRRTNQLHSIATT